MRSAGFAKGNPPQDTSRGRGLQMVAPKPGLHPVEEDLSTTHLHAFDLLGGQGLEQEWELIPSRTALVSNYQPSSQEAQCFSHQATTFPPPIMHDRHKKVKQANFHSQHRPECSNRSPPTDCYNTSLKRKKI